MIVMIEKLYKFINNWLGYLDFYDLNGFGWC